MILDNFFHKLKKYANKINIRSLSKELLIVTFGQIVSVIGSFIGIKILTNYLSPINYGELALGLTISSFFNQIIYGPLTQSVYRFWSTAVEKNRTKELFSAILFLLGGSSSIVFVITFVIYLLISILNFSSQWIALLIAASVFVFISGMSNTLDYIQQATRQRVIVAWHQLLGQWLRPLVIILLFSFFPLSNITAFWGYVLVVIIVFLSQIYFFVAKNKIPGLWKSQNKSKEWMKLLLNYAWPFCVWGIFTWGQLSFDRWSLQIFGYDREVGLYSALIQLGYSPIIILSTIVMQFLTPYVYGIAGDGLNESRLKKATRINIGASIVFLFAVSLVAIICMFINTPVMTLFSSKAYSEVSGYLPLMVFSGGLFSTGQILSISLLSRGETKTLLMPKAVTAILGMAFYFLGAQALGLRGVVFGNVAFSTIYLIWIFALLFKIYYKRSIQTI